MSNYHFTEYEAKLLLQKLRSLQLVDYEETTQPDLRNLNSFENKVNDKISFIEANYLKQQMIDFFLSTNIPVSISNYKYPKNPKLLNSLNGKGRISYQELSNYFHVSIDIVKKYLHLIESSNEKRLQFIFLFDKIITKQYLEEIVDHFDEILEDSEQLTSLTLCSMLDIPLDITNEYILQHPAINSKYHSRRGIYWSVSFTQKQVDEIQRVCSSNLDKPLSTLEISEICYISELDVIDLLTTLMNDHLLDGEYHLNIYYSKFYINSYIQQCLDHLNSKYFYKYIQWTIPVKIRDCLERYNENTSSNFYFLDNVVVHKEVFIRLKDGLYEYIENNDTSIIDIRIIVDLLKLLDEIDIKSIFDFFLQLEWSSCVHSSSLKQLKEFIIIKQTHLNRLTKAIFERVIDINNNCIKKIVQYIRDEKQVFSKSIIVDLTQRLSLHDKLNNDAIENELKQFIMIELSLLDIEILLNEDVEYLNVHSIDVFIVTDIIRDELFNKVFDILKRNILAHLPYHLKELIEDKKDKELIRDNEISIYWGELLLIGRGLSYLENIKFEEKLDYDETTIDFDNSLQSNEIKSVHSYILASKCFKLAQVITEFALFESNIMTMTMEVFSQYHGNTQDIQRFLIKSSKYFSSKTQLEILIKLWKLLDIENNNATVWKFMHFMIKFVSPNFHIILHKPDKKRDKVSLQRLLSIQLASLKYRDLSIIPVKVGLCLLFSDVNIQSSWIDYSHSPVKNIENMLCEYIQNHSKKFNERQLALFHAVLSQNDEEIITIMLDLYKKYIK